MPKFEDKKEMAHCKDHIFGFKPLREGLYFKENVQISFCKGKMVQKKKTRKSTQIEKCVPTCPIFNKDKNFATNAFILPEQQRQYLENTERFQHEHFYKINHYEIEKDEILVPKPRSKNSFCSVCRSSYENYLHHIHSDSHKFNIKRSYFDQLLKDHEKKYEEFNIQRRMKQKNHQNLQSTFSDPKVCAEYRELGKTTKKVKVDRGKQEFNQSPLIPPIPSISQIPLPPHLRPNNNIFQYPQQQQQVAFQNPFNPFQILPNNLTPMMYSLALQYLIQHPGLYWFIVNKNKNMLLAQSVPPVPIPFFQQLKKDHK